MVARHAIARIRRRGLQLAIGMMLLLFPLQAQAAVVGVGVTAKVGTTGLGVDLTVPLRLEWTQ